MSGIVSHDTGLMRDWSNEVNTNKEDYEELINRLYNLIDQFAGSGDFSGGLSRNLLDNSLNQRKSFLQYSETLNECIELINSTARNIDDDEAMLRNMIGSQNPLN